MSGLSFNPSNLAEQYRQQHLGKIEEIAKINNNNEVDTVEEKRQVAELFVRDESLLADPARVDAFLRDQVFANASVIALPDGQNQRSPLGERVRDAIRNTSVNIYAGAEAVTARDAYSLPLIMGAEIETGSLDIKIEGEADPLNNWEARINNTSIGWNRNSDALFFGEIGYGLPPNGLGLLPLQSIYSDIFNTAGLEKELPGIANRTDSMPYMTFGIRGNNFNDFFTEPQLTLGAIFASPENEGEIGTGWVASGEYALNIGPVRTELCFAYEGYTVKGLDLAELSISEPDQEARKITGELNAEYAFPFKPQSRWFGSTRLTMGMTNARYKESNEKIYSGFYGNLGLNIGLNVTKWLALKTGADIGGITFADDGGHSTIFTPYFETLIKLGRLQAAAAFYLPVVGSDLAETKAVPVGRFTINVGDILNLSGK